MKKLLIVLLILSLFTVLAHAEEKPRIILLTTYQQMGWGDRIDVGCVDEKGNLWFMTGSASALDWPYGLKAQLDYLQNTKFLELKYQLRSSDLFDLKGLIDSVEPQEGKARSAACDAGTQASYAISYDADGHAEAVLLGMSGDDVFENTDPDAQSLYQYLRLMFPEVTCYDGSMGPAGFQPVSITAFLDLDPALLHTAKIKEYLIDCEEGPIEAETVDMSLFDLIQTGSVIGKANASVVTGNITSIVFYDADDNCLGSIEFYNGLLVADDGMYLVQ